MELETLEFTSNSKRSTAKMLAAYGGGTVATATALVTMECSHSISNNIQ